VKAWQVHDHGDPVDVLTLDEVDAPQPAAGQVAVDVAAAGVNFADILLCQGSYQEKPPLPFTPGLELAGTVRAVGEGVDDLAPGQRVVALPALPRGAYAEQSLAAASDCFAIPDSLSDTSAAALTITYQTGWFGLVHRAGLRRGETLVVHAGASGVGSAAIQIGLACGAHVIATAGGPGKVELCRALGAHEVIDYRAVDLVDALRAATSGRGADVIYDPVGGDVFDASRRCLAWEGRLVVVGFASGRIPEAPANHILVKNYSVVGVHWGGYRQRDPALVRRCHDQLMAWHAAGTIEPLVMEARPLAEVPAALALLADRGAYGKIAITVS
jgi:NADPH2:quinone reductase